MSDSPLISDQSPLGKRIYETLKKSPKRVVFADGEDVRVIEAAAKLKKMGLIAPILLGDKEKITRLAQDKDIDCKLTVIQPETASDLNVFEERLTRVEKFRGREIANPREMICNPHNFAAMMVQYGQADGMIAGNQSLPVSVFRSVSNFIKPLENAPSLFGVVVLVAPQLQHVGSEGILFMADCGVNPEPSVDQLASFGLETGKFADHLLEKSAKVAFLSHSTQGCMKTASSQRVAAATALALDKARRESLAMTIVGEVQADVALDPAAAEMKSMGDGSNTSDVLVFPNLDAAHISFKFMQHVAGAQHYGQMILGLTKPAAQVPRTTSVETLFGTAILIGIEAIKGRAVRVEWD